MQISRNLFKQRLSRDQLQIGLFLGIGSAYSSEIVATTGFDWLLIDGEHAPFDVADVLAQLQALAAYPVHPVVRPVDHDTARIKQLLDIGVQTLLVPMVSTAEQARSLVRAMRYPPAGVRGVGTGLARAARWNAVNEYFSVADGEMCLLVQIECKEGVENLDEILSIDGVDGAFIGPADLAASLGYLGEPHHPAVQGVIESMIKKIVASGKAAGIFMGDPVAASKYALQGIRLFGVGADTVLLRIAALQLVDSFKPLIEPQGRGEASVTNE